MAQIITTSSFLPENLKASGLYIHAPQPAGFSRGQQTNVLAKVGTASWGPKNKAILVGSPEDVEREIGLWNSLSLTDPYDLAFAACMSFGQSQFEGGMLQYIVRATDGTDAAATRTFVDTAGSPANGIVLTAYYTGVGGNFPVTFAAGTLPNTVTVTMVRGGRFVETYKNLPSVGAGVFWANLKTALENGTVDQPPSKLVIPSSVSASAIAPALGTWNLSGGTDGRAVNAAAILGTDGSSKTGAYALRSLSNPSANIATFPGLHDTSVWVALKDLGNSEGFGTMFDHAKGTTTSAAKTAKNTLGIADPNSMQCLFFVRVWDTQNAQQRLIPASSIIAGRMAILGPHESPGNKEVSGVIGTERDDTPISFGEQGDLESNGLLFIMNPIPAGKVFGIRHGMSTSNNALTAPVEYSRMVNFVTREIDEIFGPFVNSKHGSKPNDPTRRAIKASGDARLSELQDRGIIEDWKIICSGPNGNNTTETIARGYLFVDVAVKTFASARWIVVRLNLGTNVDTNNAPGGQNQF